MKYAYLLITAVLVFGCSKKDDNTTPANNNTTQQPTKKALLIAKAWKYYAWTATPPEKDSTNNNISDILHYKPACEQDDILIFYTNGLVDFDQGPTRCKPTDDQTLTYTWSFSTDETKLNMAGSAYQLDAITANTMVLSFDTFTDTVHHHVVTFVH